MSAVHSTPLACFTTEADGAIPIRLVPCSAHAAYRETLAPAARAFLDSSLTAVEAGASLAVHDADGTIDHFLLLAEETIGDFTLAAIVAKLGERSYRLDLRHFAEAPGRASWVGLAYGWALACYRFEPFLKKTSAMPRLWIADPEVRDEATHLAEAVYLARDLINLPTNHLGPQELVDRVLEVGKRFGAELRRIDGEALLAENYPAIHAVGRAATNTPALVELRWGDPSHPRLSLVGKGVCFDTGGLDIKPAAAMKLMKKDMGGAAVSLALAQLVMARRLPVRLRLLVPAVENSIAGNAFRPQDVIDTRKGLTVEIGNTDAEGRLILADALADADDESPDLLIDCATLTGAARVALGTEIPVFFTSDEALAASLGAACAASGELLWRLPMFAGYAEQLESRVADLNNAPDSPYAGAITAALFLARFVERTASWLHVDLMAWNLRNRPGRPIGGEAQGLRALFELIVRRYGVSS